MGFGSISLDCDLAFLKLLWRSNDPKFAFLAEETERTKFNFN